MKCALVLSLASGSLALPFGKAIDSILGTNIEKRQVEAPPIFSIPSEFPTFPAGALRPSGIFGGYAPTGVFPGTGFPTAPGTGYPTAPGTGFPTAPVPTRVPTTSTPGLYWQDVNAPSPSAVISNIGPHLKNRQVDNTPGFTLMVPSVDLVAPTPTGLYWQAVSAPSSSTLPTLSAAPYPYPSGVFPRFPCAPHPTGGYAMPTGLPHLYPTGVFPGTGVPFPTGGYAMPTGVPHLYPTGVFPGTGVPCPTGGYAIPSASTTLAKMVRRDASPSTDALSVAAADEKDGEKVEASVMAEDDDE